MQLILSSYNKNWTTTVTRFMFVLAVTLPIFSGCANKSSENQKVNDEISQATLYDEVIELHDVAMPKLGNISSLKAKIEEQIGQLEASDSADEVLAKLRDQMNTLDAADQAMWQWMRQFEANYEGWEEEKILKYLKEQKELMGTINVQIDDAIASANALLQ